MLMMTRVNEAVDDAAVSAAQQGKMAMLEMVV
jgi:hypothetical protein